MREARQAVRRDGAAVEKRHDAELAQAHPRLEREFGKAASADRVVLAIARAEILIAIAAHRAAAAGVEAPRGRDFVERGAEDGAEADAAGQHELGIAERNIGARVEPN